MDNLVTLKAQCHCGHAAYTYTLPKSCFPLKSPLCHCESCRHVTGQIFATFAVIPTQELPDVSKLKGYVTSGTITRYFCPTCGASMINIEGDEWAFATGVLSIDGKPEFGALDGLLDRVQIWVSDTVDAGGSTWLSGDWTGKRYLFHRNSNAVTDAQLRNMASNTANTPSNTKKGEALRANCHCGNIKITIERPQNGTRYGGGLDACRSCRKVGGFEINAWIFLERSRVSINNHGLNLEDSNLSHYKTSQEVDRYFCSSCGATVFYMKDEKIQSPTIDLAAGLVTNPGGVLVRDWVEWAKDGEYLAFADEASDDQLVKSLIEGMRNNHAELTTP